MPFGHGSLDKTLYVDEWPRIVGSGRGDSNGVETGACTHDGECFHSGCGYACLSTRDPHPFGYECIGLPYVERVLRDHYCGCVEGTCLWFTQ